MKLLYLCFVELLETSGISKKMLYQVKALQNAGFDVKLCYEKVEDDKISRKIYNSSITLEEVKNKKIQRQFLHYKYRKLIEYILKENNLNVVSLGRGMAWLDTGTHDALLEASNFVKTIQSRQGVMVACLEEIAYRNGWIDKKKIKELAQSLIKSSYGRYLLSII